MPTPSLSSPQQLLNNLEPCSKGASLRPAPETEDHGYFPSFPRGQATIEDNQKHFIQFEEALGHLRAESPFLLGGSSPGSQTCRGNVTSGFVWLAPLDSGEETRVGSWASGEIHQKESRTENIHTQPHGPLIRETDASITKGEKQVRIHKWQEMVRAHTKPQWAHAQTKQSDRRS